MRRAALLLVAVSLSAGSQAHRAVPRLQSSGAYGAFGPPVCKGAIPPAPPHPTVAEMVQRQEIAAADPSFSLTQEPVGNIGALRFRLRDYADCTDDEGCYWADLDAQTWRAFEALERRVKQRKHGEKLALVLDIDETSLTNYCEEVREDFGFLRVPYDAWLESEEASMPLPGTLRLFQQARASGVAVFFITGRSEAMRPATVRNLHAAGYEGWKGLSLRQPEDTAKSVQEYKSGERAKIAGAGYTVVLNVGDQWNDLEGAPLAERSVKLPNPFYYLK